MLRPVQRRCRYVDVVILTPIYAKRASYSCGMDRKIYLATSYYPFPTKSKGRPFILEYSPSKGLRKCIQRLIAA